MKGLILKDIYCLRTRIMTYVLTLVAALAIGILISLSSEYGNLKLDVFMGDDTSVSEDDMAAYEMILGGATFLAILLPLGVGFDGTMTFHMDEKANFGDVLRTMPVKPGEIVLARFCTAYGFLLTGYVSSVLIALLLSPVVSIFTLGEMIYYSSVMSCVIAMGTGSVCCALYLWRQKTCEKILVGLILAAYIIFGMIIVWLDKRLGDELDIMLEKLWEYGKTLIDTCLFWLLPIALIISVGCYFLSVFIVKRKGAGV